MDFPFLHEIYISQAFIFHRIDCRSIVVLRDHTGVKNSRTLARRPVQFSAGPGESRSCGCCSSRQNKLVQFSFYSGLVCYHIPVSHPSSDRCPHPLSMTLRHILSSSQSRHPSSPFPYHLPDNPAPNFPIQPLSFVLAPVITTCLPSVSCPRLGHPPPLHGINPTPLQILTRAPALVPNLTSLCHLWTILLSLT